MYLNFVEQCEEDVKVKIMAESIKDYETVIDKAERNSITLEEKKYHANKLAYCLGSLEETRILLWAMAQLKLDISEMMTHQKSHKDFNEQEYFLRNMGF